MVILPAEKSAYPEEEIRLREEYLRQLVSANTQLEVGFMEGGACFKDDLNPRDFDRDEEIVAPARAAESDGVDAAMVHCVFDPGVANARAKLDMPVVGPGESAMVF